MTTVSDDPACGKSVPRADFDPTASGPLEGVKVIDFSRLVSGGHCTVVLADLGAEVIKVERPDGGDELRTVRGGHSFSPYFEVYGRNKRSVALDLKTEEGRQIAHDLAAKADLVVENFTPGTLERLGCAPDSLQQVNPGLVVVRISGWGQTGPYADRRGFGTLAEAVSGFMIRNGYEDRPPVPAPTALADMVAGLYAAMSAVAAVLHVRGGGSGQVIDISLFEPLMSMMGPDAVLAEFGEVPKRGEGTRASSVKGTFRCADGQWVAISAGTESTVSRLLGAVGLEHLLDDPRFASYAARVVHQAEMNEQLQAEIGKYERAEAIDNLQSKGVTVAPIYDIHAAINDPHMQERGSIVDLPTDIPELERLRMHGIVPRMSATPSGFRRPAPKLGEHTEEVLRHELGLADAEIDRLVAVGAVQLREDR